MPSSSSIPKRQRYSSADKRLKRSSASSSREKRASSKSSSSSSTAATNVPGTAAPRQSSQAATRPHSPPTTTSAAAATDTTALDAVAAAAAPPEKVSSENGFYSVEDVVARRFKKIEVKSKKKSSKTKQTRHQVVEQYKIRWEGYDSEDDEWVAVHDMSGKLLLSARKKQNLPLECDERDAADKNPAANQDNQQQAAAVSGSTESKSNDDSTDEVIDLVDSGDEDEDTNINVGDAECRVVRVVRADKALAQKFEKAAEEGKVICLV